MPPAALISPVKACMKLFFASLLPLFPPATFILFPLFAHAVARKWGEEGCGKEGVGNDHKAPPPLPLRILPFFSHSFAMQGRVKSGGKTQNR